MSSKVRFGPNLLITIPARGFWKRRIMKASQKFALDHTLIGSKASCTTGGNHRSDYTGAAALLASLAPTKALLADKGYDADWLREALADQKIEACIPSKSNRKIQIPHDRLLYRKRHKIENMFGKLKDWRRIHTRYERCAHTFMSAIAIAAIVIFWI